jgi:hypothetical protein
MVIACGSAWRVAYTAWRQFMCNQPELPHELRGYVAPAAAAAYRRDRDIKEQACCENNGPLSEKLPDTTGEREPPPSCIAARHGGEPPGSNAATGITDHRRS